MAGWIDAHEFKRRCSLYLKGPGLRTPIYQDNPTKRGLKNAVRMARIHSSLKRRSARQMTIDLVCKGPPLRATIMRCKPSRVRGRQSIRCQVVKQGEKGQATSWARVLPGSMSGRGMVDRSYD